MRIALCNEVLTGRDFAAQCAYAAALGYDGLEVAPFTLADEPDRIDASTRTAVRRAASDAGIAITGLHWLLVKPAGLSITSPDAAVRTRTTEMLRVLVDLCAELGGSYLVHGSPAQRRIHAGEARSVAWARARDAFAVASEAAGHARVTYLIEPLPKDETDLINTLGEAAAMVREIGHPALKTMLDTKSAALSEQESVAALIARWLPTGLIGHVQLNDRNRRGPGQGGDRFAPVLEALVAHDYAGDIAIEPFDYVPDGPGCAARAIGYVRGLLEALPTRGLR
jgi:D-psicose/D-tagatose/L-ribulose 3-epimerase